MGRRAMRHGLRLPGRFWPMHGPQGSPALGQFGKKLSGDHSRPATGLFERHPSHSLLLSGLAELSCKACMTGSSAELL